jgi:hypothetical protein
MSLIAVLFASDRGLVKRYRHGGRRILAHVPEMAVRAPTVSRS